MSRKMKYLFIIRKKPLATGGTGWKLSLNHNDYFILFCMHHSECTNNNS